MKTIYKKLFRDKLDICIMAFLILLFGYFGIFCEVVECGDSFQYMKQYPMREPVYSLFLQILQVTFKDSYIAVLGVLQNLLAIICIYWTYYRIGKLFNFKFVGKIVTAMLLVSPHIITPVASKTHLIITSSILTEGIAVSLYYVWMTMLFGVITGFYESSNSIKANVIIVVLSLILAMTRGQMVLCFAMWLVVVSLRAICSRKYKRIILYALLIIVCLVVKTQVTRIYNKLETGYYVDTLSSKPMLLANIVYVCDENDAEYISNEAYKNAFRNIMSDAISKEQNVIFAGKGIINRARYHESVHDSINFDCIDPLIREVIKEKYGIDETEFFELLIREEEICSQIAKELLPHVWGKYLKNYFVIASLGFVRTIAIERAGLYIWAILMYVLALVLIIAMLRNKKEYPSINIMIFVLVTICGTVLGTSLVIQCITRYMIYNLPFFYVSIVNLLSKTNNKLGGLL